MLSCSQKLLKGTRLFKTGPDLRMVQKPGVASGGWQGQRDRDLLTLVLFYIGPQAANPARQMFKDKEKKNLEPKSHSNSKET